MTTQQIALVLMSSTESTEQANKGHPGGAQPETVMRCRLVGWQGRDLGLESVHRCQARRMLAGA